MEQAGLEEQASFFTAKLGRQLGVEGVRVRAWVNGLGLLELDPDVVAWIIFKPLPAHPSLVDAAELGDLQVGNNPAPASAGVDKASLSHRCRGRSRRADVRSGSVQQLAKTWLRR
jgi:hypothetical protein